MKYNAELVAKEGSRIEEEYRRREIEINQDLYAPWQPAQNLIVSERKRVISMILHKLGKFPNPDEKCLEIGYGKLGWLADLISWGLKETDLYGIELDASRAAYAQQALPKADLRVGDATKLPWENETFSFVIVSTLFSSILEPAVRELIAEEVKRVLMSGGVVIWYDLAVNNPKNSNVKGLNAKQIGKLFPNCDITVKSVTLAPPIARMIAPKSFVFSSILSSIPFLRTHLAGVLVKSCF